MGSWSPGAPHGSSWPLAQLLVTKKMAPGDQPSWLGGVSLFTRAWCPPDNPARACCPDKGPLLPQAWAQTRRTSGTVDWGLALGSNPLPVYLLMEKQQCRPDRLLLESMSLVSPFRKSHWPLFSFLWPSLSTGLLEKRCSFLPFHSLRPTEIKSLSGARRCQALDSNHPSSQSME